MLKKTLALLAGLAISVVAYAATTHLRPGHPDSYVVQKGDTLWDISARFLTEPWLWPEIWQANPQVHNPHLIYPGDVLNLAYDHGGTLKLEPRAREEGAPVTAIPLAQLRMFLRDMRVVSSNSLRQTPYVVAFEENQLRGVAGKFVYVRRPGQGPVGLKPGQKWAIVRPSHVFRQFEDDGDAEMDRVAHDLDSNVGLVSGPWKENFRNDGHYGRGTEIGTEVRVIGTASVLRDGDPATLLVDDSTREIRKGDRLMPVDAHPYDPYFYPHPPKSMPADARVIAFTDALHSAGKREVVALSVGSADGIDNGTTFSIFQPGERIHDDVASNSMFRGTGEHVTLPDEFIGHVMVFRTFDKVSYGLIMDGVRPVHKGDKLTMPE